LQGLYARMAPPAAAGPAGAGAAGAAPPVSIIVPVRREARYLPPLMEQLLAQDYPDFEVLIADGGVGEAGDGTTEVAQAWERRGGGRVRWLANPARSSAAGRNRGLEAARGEWVVFVDGHCRVPGPDWLRQSMAAAQAQGAWCLSRRQPLWADGGGVWQRAIAAARTSWLGHGRGSTIYGPEAEGWVNPSSSGAAYRRALFLRFGTYDERFDACEDVEFNFRLAQAGVRAWLAPEAAVGYAARASLSGLWQQMVRYGRGRMRLARKHKRAWTPAQCLPALWLAVLPLAAAGALTAGAAGVLARLGLGAYAGAVALTAAGIGRREGGRAGLAAGLALPVIHAGLGAGFWSEWLRPLRFRPSAAAVMSAAAHVIDVEE
ncbi:MAG: glycosyltransferase, partial [Terriglobales bacterium]